MSLIFFFVTFCTFVLNTLKHTNLQNQLSENVPNIHLTSFVLLLFSHHSCTRSLALFSLHAQRNISRGEFPCSWRWWHRAAETTQQSWGDNDLSSWLPYRTSVKQSFVSAAFLCVVLLFSLFNQTKLITFIFWAGTIQFLLNCRTFLRPKSNRDHP